MDFLAKEIEKYINRHTTGETTILNDLVRQSEAELEYTEMISGRQVGQLLKLIVRIGGYKRVLEVGTFTGYSAIWIADALPDDGEVITLELNERYTEISNRFFAMPPYEKKIRQIMGPALDTIESLEGEFDMIFIDADKIQYPDYFLKLKPKLIRGGVLAIDNVLWGGSVINPEDDKSKSVDNLNKLVSNDSDFEQVILPVRDGVMMAVKI